MYKYKKPVRSSISSVPKFEGETIEQMVERMMHNKEGIESTSPLIYQERGEGVNPAYDPRTDRFEHALESMDKINRSIEAKAKERAEMKVIKNDDNVAKGEPTDGTTSNDKSSEK